MAAGRLVTQIVHNEDGSIGFYGNGVEFARLDGATKKIDVLSGGELEVSTGATLDSQVPLQSSGALGAIGYATGAGGAVTQITSAATTVVLSKPCGQITTVALTTAAAAEERFTVTNTIVAATDTIILSTNYNGAGLPMLSVVNVAVGAFDIVISNVAAAVALNAVMVINFAVIKAVAA
ncbi:MAG: hypothetical protein H0U59_00880 [Gemmatimonadaceae bacterium]|nr:hypothetical protein [Gemmatimonadaceae bacterium]